MRYLVIDGMLNGTGIRDQYTDEYLSPEKLMLKVETINNLKSWLLKYEDEHYNGYTNQDLINDLDEQGMELARLIKLELLDVKVKYFSDAFLKEYLI
jgi:hypothetical protein